LSGVPPEAARRHVSANGYFDFFGAALAGFFGVLQHAISIFSFAKNIARFREKQA